MLKSINNSNFNTENVEFMNVMFYNSSQLSSIDISKFNTENVKFMNDMFSNCSNLTPIDVLNNRNYLNKKNKNK